MIDLTFAMRNLRGSLARFRVVLGFIAAGAAALLLLSAVVGQGAAQLSHRLEHGSAVSALQLASDGPAGQGQQGGAGQPAGADPQTRPGQPAGSVQQLDRGRLDAIRRLAHVRSVDAWAQQGIMPADARLWVDRETPSVFWATPRIAYMQPKLVATVAGASRTLSTLGPLDVVLPSKLGGRSLHGVLGATFEFGYTLATGASSGVDQHVRLSVVGLYDNSVPGADGPAAAYVSPALEDRLIAARLGLQGATSPGASYAYPAAYVRVDDASHVAGVQARLVAQGFTASSIAGQVTELPGLLHLLGGLDAAIAVVLAVFCLGSGISFGAAWLAERGRQIGLLRALGWSRGRVFRALLLEMLAAGVVCGVVGVVAGVAASLVASLLLASRTVLGIEFAAAPGIPEWYWFAGILVVVPVALGLGALRPLSRLARIPPDDALRQL